VAEWKLFEDHSHVSTFEFHKHRERAPHLEQSGHKARLNKAAQFVQEACLYDGNACSVSDLGCGDGGLLSVVQRFSCVSRAWGYDFQPSNERGWAERGVVAYQVDVFNPSEAERHIEYGRISVTTEVLEHLVNPHGVVRRIAQHSNYMVASSPYDENDVSHDECHSWAWDMEGYRALFENNGWEVKDHVAVDAKFQVLWAVRR
jgi:2-polyprenyl-3-methyl-5-hydroxy-6-metoxy-1,4-benzoquinol methylase